MTKKAFIFDLDGVIVDTARFHFIAWRDLAASLGIEFTHHDNEQLKGVSRVGSLQAILKLGHKTVSEDEFQALMDRKNEHYLELIGSLNHADMLPGVAEFLNELTLRKLPVALGSASKNARPILNKLGVTNQFHAIVDGTDVTNPKPDPEVFLQGAAALNAHVTDCIVFEDSIKGVQAANTAGMYSIGIGDATELSAADEVFTDFSAFPSDMIDQLLQR